MNYSTVAGHSRVAVVLPVYNVEKYLAESLDSLLAQTYRHFTIFAVNDGSPDGSRKILASYASADDRIIVLDKSNGGPSSARNAGLAEVERRGGFDYVYFLDADDRLAPEALNTVVRAMEEENADYAVFSFRCFTVEGLQPAGGRQAQRMVLDNDGIAAQFFQVGLTGGHIPNTSATSFFLNNRVFRCDALKGARFNEAFHSCEDRDFLVRVMPLLHRGIVLPETLFFYRRRFSSMSNGRSAKVADFLVYQKLYADREKYSPAIRRGLELEFLNHMIQELYAVLGSSVSGAEKRRFFRYCQQACNFEYEFPLLPNVQKKIRRIGCGYWFNLVWARSRDALKVLRNKRRERRYFP